MFRILNEGYTDSSIVVERRKKEKRVVDSGKRERKNIYKIGGQRSTLAERPLAVIMIIDFGGSGGAVCLRRSSSGASWVGKLYFSRSWTINPAPYITVFFFFLQSTERDG